MPASRPKEPKRRTSPRAGVPVLMYHSVGRPIPEWGWSYLTVPWRIFQDHLRWLEQSGYRTTDLAELHRHVAGAKRLPPRSVVLTFDDGYADNWVFAAPLLREHRFEATVFVNPQFVDPRDVVRPTLHEVASGGVREQDLDVRSFLSWSELARLQDEGILSIGSHLLTHTWYPIAPDVVDFHHPDDTRYWLDWNARPEKKPFYLRDLPARRAAPGAPVYAHAKSMQARRFFPDEEEYRVLAGHVAERGGTEFFRRGGWRDDLRARLHRVRESRGVRGRWETDEQRRERWRDEIVISKRIIEERLGRPAEFMAWPGGAYTEETVRMADDVYRSVTLSSGDRGKGWNSPGDDPRRVSRHGVPTVEAGGRILYPGGRYLVRFLDELCGSRTARRRRQALKLFYLFAAARRRDS